MIILDENIIDSQRQLLISWGFAVKQIGYEIEPKGMSDREILSLLHKLKRTTFVTRDSDFFEQTFCHHAYCLLYMPVLREEVAFFTRRFMKHSHFNSQKKRLGIIAQVSHSGISYWTEKSKELNKLKWK